MFDYAYYGTLGAFSKVSQSVLGSMGQSNLQERRPPRRELNEDSARATDGEFEMVCHEMVWSIVSLMQ